MDVTCYQAWGHRDGGYGGLEGYERPSVAQTGDMFGVNKYTIVHTHTNKRTVKQLICSLGADKYRLCETTISMQELKYLQRNKKHTYGPALKQKWCLRILLRSTFQIREIPEC